MAESSINDEEPEVATLQEEIIKSTNLEYKPESQTSEALVGLEQKHQDKFMTRKEVSEYLKSIYHEMGKIDKKIYLLKQKALNTSKNIAKVKSEITVNFISVFGIFSSIVAFLLVEVQILEQVCNPWKIFGMTLLIAGVLLIFISFLLAFFRIYNNSQNEIPRNLFWTFIALVCLMMFIGGSIFIMAKSDELCLNELDKRVYKLENYVDFLKGR